MAPKRRNTSRFKSSLYLFCSHTRAPYSLYKIDLQKNHHPDHGAAAAATLEYKPLNFFHDGKCPTGMSCALLGSKLYFLGGQYIIFRKLSDHCPDEDPDYDEIFPRHLYEFDTSNGTVHMMKDSLCTGKPDACVFAAAGKIFALGTKRAYLNCSPRVDEMIAEFAEKLELFECFDPSTKQWQPLRKPPTKHDVICWYGCNVLEQRGKVVLSALEYSRSTWTVLVHDLHQNTWEYYDDPIPYKMMVALNFLEGDSHAHLYGLLPDRAPVIAKLDLDTMLRKSENIPSRDDDDEWVEMSISGLQRNQLEHTFVRMDYSDDLNCSKRLLCYLGDRHFCYIESGRFDMGCDIYGDPIFDPYTWGITITLCKDISDDDDVNIDGNTTAKGGGDYFPAEILHSRKYVITNPEAHNLGTLEKCFAV